jgi:hypothetical protein
VVAVDWTFDMDLLPDGFIAVDGDMAESEHNAGRQTRIFFMQVTSGIVSFIRKV